MLYISIQHSWVYILLNHLSLQLLHILLCQIASFQSVWTECLWTAIFKFCQRFPIGFRSWLCLGHANTNDAAITIFYGGDDVLRLMPPPPPTRSHLPDMKMSCIYSLHYCTLEISSVNTQSKNSLTVLLYLNCAKCILCILSNTTFSDAYCRLITVTIRCFLNLIYWN